MEIKANDVTVKYMVGTPFEKVALHKINFTLRPSTYHVFIGKTGSGKSTFIQLLNGLLKPTEGSMLIGEKVVNRKTKMKQLYHLRKEIGMVFQFPEHQLFHDTVLEDVAFGPMNLGVGKVEAEKRAEESLSLVGISPSLYMRSPYELSGGQMRRVAIAGVLAMEPKVLVLDEPTAGLDPVGHIGMMELFNHWFKAKEGRSVILVTHNMEDAARYGEEIHVMYDGERKLVGTPSELFTKETKLNEYGISLPNTLSLLMELQRASGQALITDHFEIDDTVDEIVSFLRKDIENNA
ncbi:MULTISPECIES: energy-coupling factor transporter ATPase [Bacillaceae]|uniref:Energy-coupling factor transporter ATP-binding protein EcfA2 n=1 Tax=Evansella alkalicola TaxID=745819 RepID=A0ABS6JNQ6_9BACI|nr:MULTISPECIES: energy-coupling factor transporter ATPase [Bacillaceae]MBU9720193.1 energy-coupling factor transporter ATPase [Bacillus alkalicola]